MKRAKSVQHLNFDNEQSVVEKIVNVNQVLGSTPLLLDISHPENDHALIESTKLSESVLDDNWLEGSHIDDFCTKIVHLNRKDGFFLVCPSFLLAYISLNPNLFSSCYNFLIRYNATNY